MSRPVDADATHVNVVDDVRVRTLHSDRLLGGPVVVLVGVPGAGKSTVGRALAERLGVGFRDTDADVESSTGRLIADIFVESGEPEFRRLEASAVAAALGTHGGILALGGGAVADPTTRSRLVGLPVVWLRVGLATASQRVGLSGARPVLLGNVRSQMKALMDSRAPLYSEVASLVVDTDERSVEETVEAIVASLGSPGTTGRATAPASPAVNPGQGPIPAAPDAHSPGDAASPGDAQDASGDASPGNAPDASAESGIQL